MPEVSKGIAQPGSTRGTVAEPLGPGEPYTNLPSIAIPKHLQWLEFLFDVEKGEGATILGPSKGEVHRGRPKAPPIGKWFYKPKTSEKGPKADGKDKPSGNGRKPAFPYKYLMEGADVGGYKPSKDELYGLIERRGVKVGEIPYSVMLRTFGDCKGYRDGNMIYIQKELSDYEKMAVACHELFEDANEPHKAVQSRALGFAGKVDSGIYETLWELGREVGLN